MIILRKYSKTLLIASGILSVGLTSFAIVSYSLTKKLVKIALDLEVPKTSEKSRFKISGITATDPEGKKIYAAAQNLKNTVSKTIEIQGHDGENLVGH